VQLAQDPDKRVLHDVFRLVTIARVLERDCQRAAQITLHELIERARLARADEAHEIFITVQRTRPSAV
jgi:hypothetical protein